MTLDQFQRVVVAAFGKAWVMPAAEALGIHHSKLQRMAVGKEMLYPDTARLLTMRLALRRDEITALLRELGEEA